MSSAKQSPEEVTESAPQFQVPCAFRGLESFLAGGALGYVFGFVSTMVMHRGGGGFKGRFAASRVEGGSSMRTFAMFGGIYAAAQCYVKRLRNKEDPYNAGLGGCATGLVVGIKSGPFAMVQGCLGIGLVSFYLERIGLGAGSANAAPAATSAVGAAASNAAAAPSWLLAAPHLILRPAAAVFSPCSSHGPGCDVGLFGTALSSSNRPALPPRPRLHRYSTSVASSSATSTPELPGTYL